MTNIVNATGECMFSEDRHNSPVEPVMGFMAAQLTGVPVGPAALPDVDLDGVDDHDDQADTPAKSLPIRTREEKSRLLKVVSQRFVEAREMNGLSQSEAAKALGFANPTQANLWEQGKRLPPLAVLIRASGELGVSLDYLLGLDDQPERDSRLAERNLMVRRMRGLLERNSAAVADALLSAFRFDPTPELRATRFVTIVQDLCRAVTTFQVRNEDVFEDLPGGAMLARTAKDAEAAVASVAELIDHADRRAEFALKRAREAMAEPAAGAEGSA